MGTWTYDMFALEIAERARCMCLVLVSVLGGWSETEKQRISPKFPPVPLPDAHQKK